MSNEAITRRSQRPSKYPYVCDICGAETRAAASYSPTVDRVRRVCRACSKKSEQERRLANGRTQILKKMLINERGAVCQRCGVPSGQLDAHHIKPVRHGGQTTKDNLLLLCEECHKQAHGAAGVSR